MCILWFVKTTPLHLAWMILFLPLGSGEASVLYYSGEKLHSFYSDASAEWNRCKSTISYLTHAVWLVNFSHVGQKMFHRFSEVFGKRLERDQLLGVTSSVTSEKMAVLSGMVIAKKSNTVSVENGICSTYVDEWNGKRDESWETEIL